MSRLVYPRLPASAAAARFQQIVGTFEADGIEAVRSMVSDSHPDAVPVPTGGRVATPEEITEVREKVLLDLERWASSPKIARGSVAAFDADLGAALHSYLRIVPADAAHEGTWNFLTLVVFPDIAVQRFPDLHERRFYGSDRNVLRRVWIRQAVLGPLMQSPARPLGEDELVGLFERTALSRNHRLLRRLAETVLAHEGNNRSQWARQLYKRVTFATGARMLDLLDDDELEALIRGEEQVPEPPMPEDAPVPIGHSPGEENLTRLFHRELVRLCERSEREINYRPTFLIRMIATEGGVDAARRLARAERASDGFVYLWEHQRLDLSVESLMLRTEFRDLFDENTLERAEYRLRMHGYSD